MKDLNLFLNMDRLRSNPTAFSLRISQLLFRHLKIYTGWSFFNMLISLPFLFYSSGSLYYFMLMNFTWGLVNMGFAGLFYWHIYAQRFRSAPFKDQIKIQRHICKMLFINILLDMVYILTGIYFLFFDLRSNLIGIFMAFGVAILIQGIFLLVQDLLFYSRHRENLLRGEKGIWTERTSNRIKKKKAATFR